MPPLELTQRKGNGDKALSILGHLCLGLFLLPVVWIVTDLTLRGASRLSIAFLIEAPEKAGRAGGIGPMLVATLFTTVVCAAVVLPVGLAAAIGLAEHARERARFVRWTRSGLDVLAGAPSIAFGMFGHTFFCDYLGLGVSILSGGLTLACMVLPLFVRLAEHALRRVPTDLRRALDALAISKTRALYSVILPSALPGIVAAAGLALARSVAETAAVLFTCGYVTRMPTSLSDPGRVISVHIYDLAMNVAGGDAQASATALVLVAALALSSAGTALLWRRCSSPGLAS